VAVIFAGGPPAAQAAKRATSKVPVVFTSGDDPIKIGLVSSLSRPSANVTGVSMLFSEVQAKRLELLHEIIPTTKALGFVYDAAAVREEVVEPATRRAGLQFYPVPATSEDELDAAFASLANRRVDAVLVGSSPRFFSWRLRIIGLAARNSLPAIYEISQYVTDGGLMSYGTSLTDAYHEAGVYVARILNGDKPGDLPVVQPTKFDLAINLKTAKTLGLTVPLTLQAAATEVVE
jgi:putative ABC transport system substrate-binding protein